MRYKMYRVTDQAVQQGRRVGLFGQTARRLSRMARRAAPVTSDQGNFRFDDFLLTVTDDLVTGIMRLYSEQPNA
jgi:hypothetical protein